MSLLMSKVIITPSAGRSCNEYRDGGCVGREAEEGRTECEQRLLRTEEKRQCHSQYLRRDRQNQGKPSGKPSV